MGREGLLPPVSSGHSIVYRVKLGDRSRAKLKSEGKARIVVPPEVREKLRVKQRYIVVRPHNVHRGYVYVYCRSEKAWRAKGLALRSLTSDRARRAKRRMAEGKPQTGD